MWLPELKTLVAGCIVKGHESQTLGNTRDANLDQWDESIKSLIERFNTAERVVPGHGEVQGTNLLQHTLEILQSQAD